MGLLFYCGIIILLMNSVDAGEGSSTFEFLVITQQDAYSLKKAELLKDSISAQSKALSLPSRTHFSSQSFGMVHGHWSLWPLFSRMLRLMEDSKSSWLIVLEPETTVKLAELHRFLNGFDASTNQFMSYGLVDKSPTIIHHFYGFDQDVALEYPDFAAGCAISVGLLSKIVEKLQDKSHFDFSIDVKHELSKFVWLQTATRLTSLPEVFCLFPHPDCVLTYVEPTYKESGMCGPPVTVDNLFGAVKTFSGYHRSRVVIVKRTWAKDLKYVEFFSDVEDHYIPTKTLGVNNTERGHCAKTLAILRHFVEHRNTSSNGSRMRWLLVADDDTLVGLTRLFRFLRCYDSGKAVIIGERYGFGFSRDGTGGYDYPTGGSGMIFSVPAAEALVNGCHCPQQDSPDDMIIGSCARSLFIPILHSAAFHQARSIDYSSVYIKRIQPITFHKFEDINPYEDFMELLYEEDVNDWRVHTEL